MSNYSSKRELIHNAIGEGSFGCVVKPALKCKDETIVHPPNSVSKIMEKIHAEEELSEMDAIDKIDPTYKFHIHKPTLCELNTKQKYEKKIKGCRRISVTLDNIKSLNILTMQNSGKDFFKLIDEYSNQSQTQENKNYMTNVWLSLVPIFEGLVTMQENNFVHKDISSNNILFNEQNNKSVLIDFGLALKIQDEIDYITQYYTKTDKFNVHWSRPIESNYILLCNYNSSTVSNITNQQLKPLLDVVKQESHIFNKNYEIRRRIYNDAIRSFDNLKQTRTTEYIDRVENGLKWEDIKRAYTVDDINGQYLRLVIAHVNKLDTYGLGLACMVLLMNTHQLIDSKFGLDLLETFYKMIHPDPFQRSLPTESVKMYKQCLKKHNITKMNILATNTVPISSVSSVRKSSKLFRKKSSTKQTHKVKQCPEGKELNPATGRCRNKCPSHKQRNSKGNCVVKTKNDKHSSKTKNKKSSIKTKKIKICPSGKELNPATGRCRNKCPPNKERNSKGNCVVKTKNDKRTSKTKKIKICPSGKELNPATGRCRNKCPPNCVVKK
jgi:serine/threonine protein kinase